MKNCDECKAEKSHMQSDAGELSVIGVMMAAVQLGLKKC